MGATGGSGTRVVARIARRAGLFLGTNLNPAEDSLAVAEYYDRWINHVLQGFDVEGEMRAELDDLVREHCAPMDGGRWGWKEPRSIFLIPFLARALPGMRFIHVVRDGRDLAFSKNQNQVRKHAWAVLGPAPVEPDDSPPRSIALWNAANIACADAAENELADRYLRIRFEDLCATPEPVAARVLGFLELEGDPAELAQEVEPPPTLGRWREAEPGVVRELQEIGTPALERFGYLDG
jgi:sulfotransferase family protein